MMIIKEKVSILEKSALFRDWKKRVNSSCYLAHIFRMLDGTDSWQLGYYNPTKDRIATFVMRKKIIEMIPEQEIFKKPGTKVLKLNLSDVNISAEEANNISEELLETKYPTYKTTKKILILQKIKGLGTIWNITFISSSLSTLNMKIDALSGNHISDNLIDLIGKKQSR